MKSAQMIGSRSVSLSLAGILILIMLGTASSAALTATSTSLSSSPNPSSYGQAVTFTAVVSSTLGPPPDGETVTFTQGLNVLGTGTLSGGSATFTISTLATGTHKVKATYAGDANFSGSVSPLASQVVNAAATTTSLVSSLNPANVGQPVSFTATVTGAFGGTVTGKVTFFNGTSKLGGATLSGGVANFTTSKLSARTNSITATYNGSGSYSGSTSNVVKEIVGSGTFIDSTMTWNSITRYYEVFVPTSLPANPPMLLMLHGTQTQSTPNPQAVISLNWGWTSLANLNSFILVKPASTYNAASGQWNWDAYYMDEAFQQPPDDSGFLRQLITTLTAQYNVNPKQVYVAGFSSGAQMAHRVAVELSDLVAAVAIASGTIVGQPTPPPITLPGAPLAPVSVQEWHGTADTEIPPCNNGTTKYSGFNFYLATVDESFNNWTQQNSCTQFANSQPLCLNGSPNPGTTGNDATGCTNNTEVQFIWENNIGHSWITSQNSTRWQFLSSHSK